MNRIESLSRAMDGDMPDELSALSAAAAQDPELRDTWSHYHLIGDVLRDSAAGDGSNDIADRVRDMIADEPTVLAPRPERSSVWKPLAGFAVAASVAAVAVVGVMQQPGGPGVDGPAVVVTPPTVTSPTPAAAVPQFAAAVPTPAVTEVAPVAAPAIADAASREAADAVAQQRLHEYLVNFNEQRARTGTPGVNPYVRMVGHEE